KKRAASPLPHRWSAMGENDDRISTTRPAGSAANSRLVSFHEEVSMLVRKFSLAALAMLVPVAAGAATRCDAVLAAFGKSLVGATCFEKGDLTTNGDTTDVNPTTPPDNSIPGLPVGAYRPRTDRLVLVNPPSDVTAITTAVPGLQISGWFASDPAHEARFLLRLPNNWNGKLVVAGTPSQRSEFSSDDELGDAVGHKGHADLGHSQHRLAQGPHHGADAVATDPAHPP